jgi:hypothetical protein
VRRYEGKRKFNRNVKEARLKSKSSRLLQNQEQGQKRPPEGGRYKFKIKWKSCPVR